MHLARRRADRDFEAEAVLVVSDKPATRRFVHAVERLGTPAVRVIWDF